MSLRSAVASAIHAALAQRPGWRHGIGMNGAPLKNDQMGPVDRTLDIIGERWTILILRELFLQGARKFQDFEQALPTISPNTLSLRLKKLERHEMVERRSEERRVGKECRSR